MIRTITIDPAEPMVIRSYSGSYAAEVARVVLESVGIPCMLLGNTFSEVGETVRLAVRRGDVSDAIAALDADAAAAGGVAGGPSSV